MLFSPWITNSWASAKTNLLFYVSSWGYIEHSWMTVSLVVSSPPLRPASVCWFGLGTSLHSVHLRSRLVLQTLESIAPRSRLVLVPLWLLPQCCPSNQPFLATGRIYQCQHLKKIHQHLLERPQLRLKLGIFSLWGESANHHTTMLPEEELADSSLNLSLEVTP